MRKVLFLKIFILLLILPVSLFAFDFGLVLSENVGFGGIEGDGAFDHKLDIVPRFSTLIGDNAEFILTAGFSLGYENEEAYYIPELLRTEFSMRFGNSGMRVGRINYTDPLSFVVDGLFDGYQYYYNSRAGSFRIGAWYTGLQYKKRANIQMSEVDQANYLKTVVYDDFPDTYFASKRMFASIGWEHPSIGELVHLNTAVIGQMDLNDVDLNNDGINEAKYHSEYVILKAGIPINNFLMEFGGSVEFSQIDAVDMIFNTAFAGEIGLFLLFPSKYNSRLSFKSIITSGVIDSNDNKVNDNGEIGAFIPITSKEYGYILKSKIPGLSIFSLNYSSKFSKTFSGSFTASYYVRSDLGTVNTYPVTTGSDGYFLGPEASARVTWGPASDLQFSLGGGAFFPSLGDAGSKEEIKWRVDFSVVMSIF